MIRNALSRLLDGKSISREDASLAFSELFDGTISPVLAGSFLTALRFSGETEEIVAGAASIMRERATKVSLSSDIIADTCGTGGDRSFSFNISTASAILSAACGIPVAKHGNRSVSSNCGSADVLEALGMKIEISSEKASKMLAKEGFAFLFAPLYHPAMKHIVPVRKELGFRTLFNLLGPLTNPCGTTVQILGVGSPSLLDLIPKVLYGLGMRRAWIFHGSSGIDELSPCGTTTVVEIGEGIDRFQISAHDFGMPSASLSELRGENPAENAHILRSVLEGKETGAKRNAVLMNTAVLLYLSQKAKSPLQGVKLASRALDSGIAAEKLHQIIKASQND
ncbi:MAG: anthranilate phosphoribosyltransferase [Candidatus Ratteibacteria bacterium]|jgi:anthranilate phosphoribosyltransferase